MDEYLYEVQNEEEEDYARRLEKLKKNRKKNRRSQIQRGEIPQEV